MKVGYIAGPFRGPSAWAVAENVRKAERVALDVWRAGAAAICPHTNTAHFDGAAPDDVWLRGDLEMLKRCDFVVMVEGWEGSMGARAERLTALRLGIPVFYGVAEATSWLRALGEPAGCGAEVPQSDGRYGGQSPSAAP
jgi:hypothetical protein